ncbi:hypothetical protein ABK040_001853 [Willaertia magna]
MQSSVLLEALPDDEEEVNRMPSEIERELIKEKESIDKIEQEVMDLIKEEMKGPTSSITSNLSINNNSEDDLIKISTTELRKFNLNSKHSFQKNKFKKTHENTINTPSIRENTYFDDLLKTVHELQKKTNFTKAEVVYNNLKEKIKNSDKTISEINYLERLNESDGNYSNILFCFTLYCRYFLSNIDKTIIYCTKLISFFETQSSTLNILLAFSLYIRATCFGELNKITEAINDYGMAIELYGGYYKFYFSRAFLFQQIGDYENSLIDFTASIAHNSNLYVAYRYRGDLYKNYFNDYEKALRDYNKAIQIQPDYYSAYNNRGVLFKKLKKYDKALEDFDKSIKLKPDSVTSYINRGVIQEVVYKDYEAAKSDYFTVCKLDPNNQEAKEGYERVGKKIRDTITKSSKKIMVPPVNKFLRPILTKVRALKQTVDLTGAFQYYFKLLDFMDSRKQTINEYMINKLIVDDSNGLFEEALFTRILFYQVCEKDYRKTIQDINLFLSRASDESKSLKVLAVYTRALTNEELHHYFSSLEDLEEILEKYDVNCPTIYIKRGLLYTNKLKDYELALHSFNQAIAIDPQNPQSYNLRGVLYEKGLKQFENALEDYKTAHSMDPKDENIIANFTKLYCLLSDKQITHNVH